MRISNIKFLYAFRRQADIVKSVRQFCPLFSPVAFLDFPPAHSHAARIMAALLLISLLLPAAAATVEICHTGYVMDLYCINRGTLLDNPSVATLVGPQEHSVHCLVDPSICYNSGFALLDAAGPGVAIATPFCAAYVLDGPGNSQALALARATVDATQKRARGQGW